MKKLLAVLAVLLAVGLAFRMPLHAQDDKEEKPAKEKPDFTKATLHCVGGLSASTAYFGFCLIGVTADAFDKGTYDAKKTKMVAEEVKGFLKRTGNQLDALEKSGGLSEPDAKAVDDLEKIFGEVVDFAQKLEDYADDKSEEKGKAYQESRKKAWKHLKKLLGIKD